MVVVLVLGTGIQHATHVKCSACKGRLLLVTLNEIIDPLLNISVLKEKFFFSFLILTISLYQ